MRPAWHGASGEASQSRAARARSTGTDGRWRRLAAKKLSSHQLGKMEIITAARATLAALSLQGTTRLTASNGAAAIIKMPPSDAVAMPPCDVQDTLAS